MKISDSISPYEKTNFRFALHEKGPPCSFPLLALQDAPFSDLGEVWDESDTGFSGSDTNNKSLSVLRPFQILFVKYWKVPNWDAKKLLKKCHKSKKLRPKFPKLLLKFWIIFMNVN